MISNFEVKIISFKGIEESITMTRVFTWYFTVTEIVKHKITIDEIWTENLNFDNMPFSNYLRPNDDSTYCYFL